MIGGTDIYISNHAGTDALDVALRLARHFWPGALIEDAGTGVRYTDAGELPLDQAPELLVYRDADAAARWDKFGAVPELDGTLIHLLLGDGSLTVTLDDIPDARVMGYVQSLRDALSQSIFNATVMRRAA